MHYPGLSDREKTSLTKKYLIKNVTLSLFCKKTMKELQRHENHDHLAAFHPWLHFHFCDIIQC
jgi:hypothetical protein